MLGVLNIDLGKRVIQHLTGVATGSNAWQKHTPQTKVASDAGCRFHIADTQPAPFADGRKQKCCSSECSGEKAERGSKIDQNRVSFSRYPRLSPLPLTFLRKACGEVPDDLNSERESRQSGSTRGQSHSRSHPVDSGTQTRHPGGFKNLLAPSVGYIRSEGTSLRLAIFLYRNRDRV